MTMPIDAEFLIALNKELVGADAGVTDLLGIQSVIQRAFSSLEGTDACRTIWDEAATLLHGIASKQYFVVGNKRTAFVATLYFLEQNGHALRDIPQKSKESAILAVATNLLDASETSEWLYENRFRASDRVEYAVLARDIRRHLPAGAYDVFGMHITGITASAVPGQTTLALVFRIQWQAIDVGRSRIVSIRSRHVSGEANRVFKKEGIEDHFEVRIVREDPPALYANGIPHTSSAFGIPLFVFGNGNLEFELCIDGEAASVIPLEIAVTPNPSDFF